MKKTPLKVGFDLDGVILYNPIRIARPLLSFFRLVLLNKPNIKFYIPKSTPEKFLWYLIHKSSFIPARGYKRLKKLVRSNKISAYLITGRYDALKSDFDVWKNKLDSKSIFKMALCNKNNLQPHEFKKQMIEKYDLDFFVEDNWDIINLLSENKKEKLTILWITNLFDQFIPFKNKFSSLNKVIDYLEERFKFR